MLGASFALKIPKPLVTGLEDLLHSDFELLINNGSAVYQYFERAEPNSIQRKIFERKVLGGRDTSSADFIAQKGFASGINTFKSRKTMANFLLYNLFSLFELTQFSTYFLGSTTFPWDSQFRYFVACGHFP